MVKGPMRISWSISMIARFSMETDWGRNTLSESYSAHVHRVAYTGTLPCT